MADVVVTSWEEAPQRLACREPVRTPVVGDEPQARAGVRDHVHAERAQAAPAPASASAYLDRVPLRLAGTVSFVPVDDVDWVGAADYYAEVHAAGCTHLAREPLQRLAARLDPARFVRIHRSTIVNVARVRTVQPHVHGTFLLSLRDGTRLVLSRTRRFALERALGCPSPDVTEGRDLERQRVRLSQDVSRRLRPVCAGIHMSERQFRETVRAIVDVKLGWSRRQLPS